MKGGGVAEWEEASGIGAREYGRLSRKGKLVAKIDESPWATAILPSDKLFVGGSGSDEGSRYREWHFAIRQMQSKMFVGFIQASRIPRRSWDDSQYVDSTWYWSSNSINGYLAKGNQFVQATPATFSKDSFISMHLDVISGTLSFFLGNGKERQIMGSLKGIRGELIPAICLQSEGDVVDIPSPNEMSRPSSPIADSPTAGRRHSVVELRQPDEKSRTVKVQTSWEGRDQKKAFFFGHASSIWQVERLLQDAEKDIASISRLNLASLAFSSHQANSVSGVQDGALNRAFDALSEVKASLYTSSSPHHEVKVVNLAPRIEHADVENLFAAVCHVMSVALKTDSDFLHPRDRGLVAAGSEKSNVVAFITVNGVGEVAKALKLDGTEVQGRKITVTSMKPSPLEAADERTGQSEHARRERAYALAAKLDGQMGRWVRHLEGQSTKAVEHGEERLEKGDVEGAKHCLARAEAIAGLLPHAKYRGAVEVMQAELEEQLKHGEAEVAEELRALRQRWAGDMEVEMEKLRQLLEARGELRGNLQMQLRERREELERQGRAEQGRLARQHEAAKGAVLERSRVARAQQLAVRMAGLRRRVAEAYPALGFGRLRSLMQRLEWLLDDAEVALRDFAQGKQPRGLVAAWEGVLAAKALASAPLPHADLAALLPRLPPDMEHPTMERLKDTCEVLHVPLQLQPDNKRLLAEIEVLTVRLNNLEGRCKLEFNPYRQTANEAVSECDAQFMLGNLPAAKRLLQEASAAASRVPSVFAPRDLELLRLKIDGEIVEGNQKELQNYYDMRDHHAPAFHFFLSFDSEPAQSQAAPDATPQDLPGRVYSALQRRGWRILHEKSAPSELKIRGASKGVGMRLVIELKDGQTQTEIVATLPSLLASDVSKLLRKERTAGKSSTPFVPVQPSRFNVTTSSQSGTSTMFVDVRVLSRKLESDPHTSQAIANAVYRAVEQDTELLQHPTCVRSCHAPFGTLRPEAPLDYAREVHGKIQQCSAVVMVVTERFASRAQNGAVGTTKAGIEVSGAAQLRGAGRVVALVEEGLGPPPSWKGILGQAIGECPYVTFSAEKDWEAVVQALHNKILATGVAPPPVALPEAATTEKTNLSTSSSEELQTHGRVKGSEAFVNALKHSRALGRGANEPGPSDRAGRRSREPTSIMRSLALSRSVATR